MTESTHIRLALVDDHAIVRQGLANMLQAYAHLNLVIVAANGQEFLDQLQSSEVDIVLLDIEMPVLNGIQTVQQLSISHPEVKAIMLSMHNDPEIAMECLRFGAASYLLKECSMEEMIFAIEQVQLNGAFLSAFSENSFENEKYKHHKRQQKQIFRGFSDRDLRVLHYLCDGLTSKEIGDRISTSKKTVDLIRTRLLKAYQVKTSNELMRLSILDGFYTPRTNEEIQAEIEASEIEKLERRMQRLRDPNG
jgi:two-component system, NarL family, response regulator DegU